MEGISHWVGNNWHFINVGKLIQIGDFYDSSKKQKELKKNWFKKWSSTYSMEMPDF